MSTPTLHVGGEPELPFEPAASAPTEVHGWRRIWRRYRGQRLAMAALGFVVLMVLAAVFAPLLAPHDPNAISADILAAPSGEHWFGTDDIGRDLLSRVLFATRTSLLASLVAVVLAVGGGFLVGVLSGYVGGIVDGVVMRVMDGLLAVPGLLMALAVVGVLGPGIRNAMIGLAISFMPTFARLVRGQVLAVKEESYVEAARIIGASGARIVRRHIVPNIAAPILIQALMSMGYALLAEGALSFLGLSVQPPGASLGNLLQRGFVVVNLTIRLILIPGLVITALSWAFNLIGDGLRDAFGRQEIGVVHEGARA